MNSIPSYSYVVNNFTISDSQYKYLLFSISFIITKSILLLVVSQIGFAQIPRVDKENFTKIIELNRSALCKDVVNVNEDFKKYFNIFITPL